MSWIKIDDVTAPVSGVLKTPGVIKTGLNFNEVIEHHDYVFGHRPLQSRRNRCSCGRFTFLQGKCPLCTLKNKKKTRLRKRKAKRRNRGR